MAIRKTGSRRIVVDGVAYRWRVRHRATNSQVDYSSGTLHLAVGSADQEGSTLVLRTDRQHPGGWALKAVVPITPSDVAGWVRHAIRLGWAPSQPGKQFELRLSGSSAELIS